MSNQKSHIISLIIFAYLCVVGLVILKDYHREADFLTSRLAQNLSDGRGMVYTPGVKTLLTASPLPVLIAAVQPSEDTPLVIASALAYTIAGGSLFRLMRRWGYSDLESLFCLVLWLASWVVWAGIRSSAGLTAMFILGGLELATHARWRWAGWVAGLAVLAQPTGLIGAALIGVYALIHENGRRFWQVVWMPGALWTGVAIGVYGFDGLGGLVLDLYPQTDWAWQGVLWLGLLIGGGLAISRLNWSDESRPMLILIGWVAGEIVAQFIFSSYALESTSLGLGVALILVTLSRQPALKNSQIPILVGLAVVMGILLIVAPPQTEKSLQNDQRLAEYLGEAKSYAHDRSDALIAELDGDGVDEIYRLDGRRSPFIDALLRREDRESLLVALAPDVLYFNREDGPLADMDMQSPGLTGLNYTQQPINEDAPVRNGDELWVRDSVIGEWGETQTLDIDYSPDVTLVGYTVDNTHLRPGETLRLRLDWQLDLPPTTQMGVYVSLLDITGNPIVSVFPRFEPVTWKPLDISTYHALLIPADAQPGLLNISVTLDYKAATLNQATIGSVFLQGAAITPPTTQIGTLGPAILYAADFSTADGQIAVNLVWGAQASFNRDYDIFLHFVPMGEAAPLRQADGTPVGGRYPTRFWQAGDVIAETRVLAMADVPTGEYQIRVGFYDPNTFERLQGPFGDFILLAIVTIGADGQITVAPPAP
ncbi:MAG: hypothetical protein DPW16_06760 [Chloroflexi bacterium]|nr:hypothetical protein [Chloroflexota bacterium]